MLKHDKNLKQIDKNGKEFTQEITPAEGRVLTFALAGNPNSGKTTLFNSLTGSSAYVGNWPGVTVEKRSGVYQNKSLGKANVVDLPGIYSLSPYSPEEIVSRDFLLEEHPDCVINVIDGTNLERNLYMTTQIMEMDIPVVVAINMMDAVKKQGRDIDCDLLSDLLGIPVVPISALKRENLHSLMKKAFEASKKPRKGTSFLINSSQKENIVRAYLVYQEAGKENPLFHAIKALENDEIEIDRNPEQAKKAQESYRGEDDFETLSADLRYQYITNHFAKAIQGKEEKASEKMTLSDKIDKVMTNKWLGIPLFLILLFVIFELTFSEDLFFLNATGVFSDGGLNTPLGWIGAGNGISSPGVFLANFTNYITGWITTFFTDIVLKNASTWVVGLVADGLLGGIFAVIGFLPQILVLFLFFSLLEDSGYMARVAFILDRLFRKFGLSGRAFIPMIMGFGCSVPAMMNTRTLTSDKERIQTIRVIPFFSCSAKLPIITAISGVLLTAFAIPGANFITYGIYVFAMVAALIAVLIMHGTTQREEIPPFIMEFPSYHLPQPRALGIHVWDKAKHFFKKTFFIITISTFAIWLFSRIGWDWQYLGREGVLFAYNDSGLLWAVLDNLEGISSETIANLIQAGKMNAEMTLVEYQAAIEAGISNANFSLTEVIPNLNQSILGSIGTLIMPIFTPMGFGLQTAYTPHLIAGANGSWAFAISALTGLVAKENAIGTFGTLASAFQSTGSLAGIPSTVYPVIDVEMDGGIGAVKTIIENTFMVNNGALVDPLRTSASLISFVMFNVTTIPCFAAVATAKSELMNKKAYRYTIAFWLFASYIIGCLTYLVISYWWTVFFVLLALGIVFTSIYFYNKKRDQKALQA